MNVRQLLITPNKFSRPNIPLKKVKGIVLHYTASNGAPAINIAKYFDGLKNQPNNSKSRYASAHYSVDENEVVQSIPDNEMAYHVGSETYTKEALSELGSYPNNCTIGIEMCIDTQGRITERTFQNAAELATILCKKFGLNERNLWTHKGVVGWKDCPLPWVKNPTEFERFKGVVKTKLNPIQQTPPAEDTKEKPKMNKQDADKIIVFLQKEWKEARTQAEKDEIHRLADEVRKASGMLV